MKCNTKTTRTAQVGNVTLVNVGRRYEPGTEDAYAKDAALLADIARQGCKCARGREREGGRSAGVRVSGGD